MPDKPDLKAYVLNCLFERPEGADPVELDNFLSRFFTMEEIDEHLQAVMQDQQSQNRLYQQGDASRWHLTAKYRKQLEEELPAVQERLKGIGGKPGSN